MFIPLLQVKEKCLDLQSHIVSLETLISEVLEMGAHPVATQEKTSLRSQMNAAVQTSGNVPDERLAKAQREVSRLAKELMDSQKAADETELQLLRTSNEKKMADEEHRQQSALLNMRIDDLTNKLNASEKNIQLMKHKLARVEKRRLSLKGKDSLNFSKVSSEWTFRGVQAKLLCSNSRCQPKSITPQDIETKLCNLEAKMLFLEDLNTMTDSQSDISEDPRTHPPVVPTTPKQAVNRRLSTDSQNSESSTAHRLYNLDQKVRIHEGSSSTLLSKRTSHHCTGACFR